MQKHPARHLRSHTNRLVAAQRQLRRSRFPYLTKRALADLSVQLDSFAWRVRQCCSDLCLSSSSMGRSRHIIVQMNNPLRGGGTFDLTSNVLGGYHLQRLVSLLQVVVGDVKDNRRACRSHIVLLLVATCTNNEIYWGRVWRFMRTNEQAQRTDQTYEHDNDEGGQAGRDEDQQIGVVQVSPCNVCDLVRLVLCS